jgi:hypothetical protein
MHCNSNPGLPVCLVCQTAKRGQQRHEAGQGRACQPNRCVQYYVIYMVFQGDSKEGCQHCRGDQTRMCNVLLKSRAGVMPLCVQWGRGCSCTQS